MIRWESRYGGKSVVVILRSSICKVSHTFSDTILNRAATEIKAHQTSRSLNTSLPGSIANMLAGNLNLTLSSGNQAKTWCKKRAKVCVEN